MTRTEMQETTEEQEQETMTMTATTAQTRRTVPSLNAVAQCYKRTVKPTRDELFAALQVPACMTVTNRYWAETYNIRPWAERTEAERHAALQVVHLAAQEGVTLREALRMWATGTRC
ncbi:MAG: hypothetical protein PHZ19_12100 [Candidatus Thermoplasmatota archaeon]|nr:hypothetical protein [Candidatus Thermoplasmatota archaeon]